MTTKHRVGRGNLAPVDYDALIAEITRTGSLEEACRIVGECSRTVLRHLHRDAQLAERVETARQQGRDGLFVHGRPGSYRRCKCAVCRFANTERMARYRRSAKSQSCPYCKRDVGVRGGRRYAHHSQPGVVCPGSESSARVQVGVPRRKADPKAEWTLVERIEQELALGTPTRRIMDLLDVDYATVKTARDALLAAS